MSGAFRVNLKGEKNILSLNYKIAFSLYLASKQRAAEITVLDSGRYAINCRHSLELVDFEGE